MLVVVVVVYIRDNEEMEEEEREMLGTRGCCEGKGKHSWVSGSVPETEFPRPPYLPSHPVLVSPYNRLHHHLHHHRNGGVERGSRHRLASRRYKSSPYPISHPQ